MSDPDYGKAWMTRMLASMEGKTVSRVETLTACMDGTGPRNLLIHFTDGSSFCAEVDQMNINNADGSMWEWLSHDRALIRAQVMEDMHS